MILGVLLFYVLMTTSTQRSQSTSSYQYLDLRMRDQVQESIGPGQVLAEKYETDIGTAWLVPQVYT
jgi:hypothetical protein